MSGTGDFSPAIVSLYDNGGMHGLPDIHDGFFDGLLVSEEKTAHLFLRTCAGRRSTVVLKDVERMSVRNFMQGNIIFDVLLVEHANLTIAHIEQAYQLQPSQAELAQKLLEEAQRRKLLALEINPSYGAELTALFGAVQILPSHVLPGATSQVST
jgi:hypothetical protein